jgi:cytochrome c
VGLPDSLPLGVAVTGDAAKNEVVFKKCSVVGRTAGTYPKFAYSPLMKAAGESGLVWTEDNIKNYLPDPNVLLKKFSPTEGRADLATGTTKMLFRLPGEEECDNVIAYLKAFSTAVAPTQ